LINEGKYNNCCIKSYQ